jgi:hypothetical protein
MQAANDVTIRGDAFAKAIRSILPRTRAGQLGYVVISPSATAGMVRLEAYYAGTDVAAEGAWADAVEVNARLLRGFAKGRQPATCRLVYFGGWLLVNGAKIGAGRAWPTSTSVPPAYVPTNRLGSPLGQAKASTRRPGDV